MNLRKWILLVSTCLGLAIATYVWWPQGNQAELTAGIEVDFPAGSQEVRVPEPVMAPLAKPARPVPARDRSKPAFFEKLSDTQKQELLAQMDEIDSIERAQREAEETEVLEDLAR